MNYYEFWFRFGGACRSKHTNRSLSILDRLYGRLFVGNKSAAATKGDWKRVQTYRRCAWPPRAELPTGFIRLDPWEAEYLFSVASRARSGIVETGRRYGGSCFLLSCANSVVPIHSIDIAPADDNRLNKIFVDKSVGANVNLIVGDSQKTKYPAIKAFDLLFVDGDHSYQGCLDDLENFYGELAPGGHVILHDCFFGCEVQTAVIDFMRRHPEVLALVSPFTPASSWTMPHGSLMHMQKPSL